MMMMSCIKTLGRCNPLVWVGSLIQWTVLPLVRYFIAGVTIYLCSMVLWHVIALALMLTGNTDIRALLVSGLATVNLTLASWIKTITIEMTNPQANVFATLGWNAALVITTFISGLSNAIQALVVPMGMVGSQLNGEVYEKSSRLWAEAIAQLIMFIPTAAVKSADLLVSSMQWLARWAVMIIPPFLDPTTMSNVTNTVAVFMAIGIVMFLVWLFPILELEAFRGDTAPHNGHNNHHHRAEHRNNRNKKGQWANPTLGLVIANGSYSNPAWTQRGAPTHPSYVAKARPTPYSDNDESSQDRSVDTNETRRRVSRGSATQNDRQDNSEESVQ